MRAFLLIELYGRYVMKYMAWHDAFSKIARRRGARRFSVYLTKFSQSRSMLDPYIANIAKIW